jgi:hypothetical protein
MGIVYLPPELEVSSRACSICRVKLTLDKATAGLFDADNHQALACVSHFSEVELLIVGWANFIAFERMRYLQHKQQPGNLIYEGGSNVWFNP